MSDIAERVAGAKKQVDDLKKQLAKVKDEKYKGFSGLSKLGEICFIQKYYMFYN